MIHSHQPVTPNKRIEMTKATNNTSVARKFPIGFTLSPLQICVNRSIIISNV